jgi:hypothetical protein
VETTRLFRSGIVSDAAMVEDYNDYTWDLDSQVQALHDSIEEKKKHNVSQFQ